MGSLKNRLKNVDMPKNSEITLTEEYYNQKNDELIAELITMNKIEAYKFSTSVITDYVTISTLNHMRKENIENHPDYKFIKNLTPDEKREWFAPKNAIGYLRDIHSDSSEVAVMVDNVGIVFCDSIEDAERQFGPLDGDHPLPLAQMNNFLVDLYRHNNGDLLKGACEYGHTLLATTRGLNRGKRDDLGSKLNTQGHRNTKYANEATRQDSKLVEDAELDLLTKNANKNFYKSIAQGLIESTAKNLLQIVVQDMLATLADAIMDFIGKLMAKGEKDFKELFNKLKNANPIKKIFNKYKALLKKLFNLEITWEEIGIGLINSLKQAAIMIISSLNESVRNVLMFGDAIINAFKLANTGYKYVSTNVFSEKHNISKDLRSLVISSINSIVKPLIARIPHMPAFVMIFINAFLNTITAVAIFAARMHVDTTDKYRVNKDRLAHNILC